MAGHLRNFVCVIFVTNLNKMSVLNLNLVAMHSLIHYAVRVIKLCMINLNNVFHLQFVVRIK